MLFGVEKHSVPNVGLEGQKQKVRLEDFQYIVKYFESAPQECLFFVVIVLGLVRRPSIHELLTTTTEATAIATAAATSATAGWRVIATIALLTSATAAI